MRDLDRPRWFAEACDAASWRLTLYENGTMKHDDAVKAIVTAVAQVASPDLAAVRRGVESGTIKGEVVTLYDSEWDGQWFGNEKREWVDVPEGRYLLIPVSDGGSET